MKRICYLLSSLMLVFFINTTSVAQTNYNQLTVNGISAIGIENMVLTDAVGTDNKIQHSASFDIKLTDNSAIKNVIAALQNAVPKTNLKSREVSSSNMQMVFVTYNNNLVITEQKFYTGITVDEIKLPDLNASDKSIAKISVKLRATTANTVSLGGKATNPGFARVNNVMVSNFKAAIGTLPCTRVMKISGTSATPVGSPEQNFTIELAGTDGAQWNQWFTSGAGGAKKEQGTIELLSANFSTALFTIQLTDISIVSYSVVNAGTTTKAVVGLRARVVAVK